MPPEMKNIVSILIFGVGLIYNSYGTLSLLSMIGAVFIYSLLIVRQMDSQLHLGYLNLYLSFWRVADHNIFIFDLTEFPAGSIEFGRFQNSEPFQT